MTRAVNSVGYGLVNRRRRMPLDRADGAEQVGEIVLAVVIAVDRLPEQRHFGGAARGEGLDLPHHVLEPPAPLGAPGERHDAEGAAVVAAALYRDERRRALFAHRRHVFVVLPVAKLDVGGTLAVARPVDQLRQVAIGVRPDDQVDLRDALEQDGAEPLGHAADHAEHVPGALVALQLAHAPDDPLFGVVPHRAGVHQHHIGLGRMVRAHVALAPEDAEHELGVRDVHLAAVGFDVDAFHGVNIPAYGRTVTPRFSRKARSE